MKKLLILLLILTGFTSLVAQSERETKLLDKLSKEACDELNRTDFSKKDNVQEIEMKLGMALLPTLSNNRQAIKDVWGLDINKQDDARKVGEKLGAYMVFRCDKFQKLAMQMAGDDDFSKKALSDDAGTGSSSSDAEVSGTIDKIEGTDVDFIYIKTDDSEIVRMLWLDRCEGSELLENYLNSQRSGHYKFRYKIQTVFQPKTKTYQSVKVITGILGS